MIDRSKNSIINRICNYTILEIHNKKINSYFDKKRNIYEIHLFPEFKQVLYIPFKYIDGINIEVKYCKWR